MACAVACVCSGDAAGPVTMRAARSLTFSMDSTSSAQRTRRALSEAVQSDTTSTTSQVPVGEVDVAQSAPATPALGTTGVVNTSIQAVVGWLLLLYGMKKEDICRIYFRAGMTGVGTCLYRRLGRFYPPPLPRARCYVHVCEAAPHLLISTTFTARRLHGVTAHWCL